jgi:hypothetical protein
MLNKQNQRMCLKQIFLKTAICFSLLGFINGLAAIAADGKMGPPVLFFSLGDSLSHGTMDATNNSTNTLNAYVQLVTDALVESQIPLYFNQPFFDDHENRIRPFVLPTNLGVDGSDIFSLVGLDYYKRIGTQQSRFNRDLWLTDGCRHD